MDKPYVERPLRDYVEEAVQGSPTPGGGSVSALAGALGTTMASMAANFTVGKKKFKAVEGEVRELLGQLDGLREKLLSAMQADTVAYGAVGAAYSMSRGTDEEKAARRSAIQAALRGAMEPPLEALRSCLEAVRVTRRLLDIANPNLITDVGVAAALLEASARGAYLNVAVNLKGMEDLALASAVEEECRSALEDARSLENEVREGVLRHLAGAK